MLRLIFREYDVYKVFKFNYMRVILLDVLPYSWGYFPTDKTMVLFTGWPNFWGIPMDV